MMIDGHHFIGARFHIAAELGHFDMSQIFIAFIIIFMDWPLKNPIFNSGLTPYHLAAESGYLTVFQLIFYEIKNKNLKEVKLI